MELNVADGLIIFVLLASTGIGIYRGFIREFLTILTWVVAGVIAYMYADTVGEYVFFVDSAKAKEIIAMIGIFLAVVTIGFIIKLIVLKAAKISGVATVDRITGALFGLLRGLILVVLVLLASSKNITDQEWYKNSQMLPKFYKVSSTIAEATPETWREDLRKELDAMFKCEQAPAPIDTVEPTTKTTTTPPATPDATTPATSAPTAPAAETAPPAPVTKASSKNKKK